MQYPLRHMTSPAAAVGQVYCSRRESTPIDLSFKPVTQLLVAPKIKVPLLPHQGYPIKSFVVVVTDLTARQDY